MVVRQQANLNISQKISPYIPASQKLPEITFKAFILGILLSMVMSGANAYLGLKIGLTISACIPAAVISMGVLRLFRASNILENNIVQTAASAGEIVASAAVFTLPGLIMIGYWDHFSFWGTFWSTTIGGILGVMLSVPLRRALIIESNLKFPEGVATAEVLKAGDAKTGSLLKDLVTGGACASLLKFAQTGFQCITESFNAWFPVKSTVVGFGGGVSAALLGAGYIVGIHSCLSILAGGVISWMVGVPLYGLLYGLPEASSAYAAAMAIWSSKIRFMGVGGMVVGGIWTIITLLDPIRRSIRSSIEAFGKASEEGSKKLIRTERDIPFNYVLAGIVLLILPVFILTYSLIGTYEISSRGTMVMAALLVTLVLFSVVFFCCSIAGYMTGIVGTTQNPLSGVAIMTILILSGVLLLLLGQKLDFSIAKNATEGAGTVVLLACIVATAAAVSGDNLQDLKSGQLVGSTPWKQQVMLIVGVLAASAVLAPMIELLYQAYGIGNMMPRPGMDPSKALLAPKAAIMASLSQSIFMGSMEWSMFILGGIVTGLSIFIDLLLKKKESRWKFPALGVALGIYLPLDITVPVLIGGFVKLLTENAWEKKKTVLGTHYTKTMEKSQQRATLLCAGFIAGESILGLLLAIPFVIYQSTDIFRWDLPVLETLKEPLGIGISIALCIWLYRVATRPQTEAEI